MNVSRYGTELSVLRGALDFAVAVAVAVACSAGLEALAADSAAAERQYKVARRLAAEGSPQAEAALREVVALDPEGPLADDALLDLVASTGVPDWPSELGRIDAARHATALTDLDRAVGISGADRRAEALYRRALLRMEPVSAADRTTLRLELLTIATDPAGGPWARRARFAVAWLDRRLGRPGRARGGLERIRIDAPGTEAATRAARELTDLDLRDGRCAAAAARAQTALSAPGSDDAFGAFYARARETAVRCVLRSIGAGRLSRVEPFGSASLDFRSVRGMAALSDGRVVVADGKSGEVVAETVSGERERLGVVEDATALAVDGYGRVWVAGEDALVRFVEGRREVVVGLDGFGEVSSLAVDAIGDAWILDRKGDALARWSSGASSVRLVVDGFDPRLEAIAWDGRRLVALTARDGDFVEIEPSGALRRIRGEAVSKPEALSVDPLGQVVSYDDRDEAVVVLAPNGEEVDRVPLDGIGVSKFGGVAAALDGSIWIYDDAARTVVRVR